VIDGAKLHCNGELDACLLERIDACSHLGFVSLNVSASQLCSELGICKIVIHLLVGGDDQMSSDAEAAVLLHAISTSTTFSTSTSTMSPIVAQAQTLMQPDDTIAAALLARITSSYTTMSNEEGVAIAGAFYQSCMNTNRMRLFKYALTLEPFKRWWWSSQQREVLSVIQSCIIKDDVLALRIELARLPKEYRNDVTFITTAATSCVRYRAEKSWIELTSNGASALHLTEHRADYLVMALTPEIPLVIVRDAIERVAAMVRAGSMSMENAVCLLRELHLASIGHENEKNIAATIISAQAHLLEWCDTAAAAAAAANVQQLKVDTESETDDAEEEKSSTKRARKTRAKKYEQSPAGREAALRDLFEPSETLMHIDKLCSVLYNTQQSLCPTKKHRTAVGVAIAKVFGRDSIVSDGHSAPQYYLRLKQ
jgi:hypothetical protein